jgi:hypothetical protein
LNHDRYRGQLTVGERRRREDFERERGRVAPQVARRLTQQVEVEVAPTRGTAAADATCSGQKAQPALLCPCPCPRIFIYAPGTLALALNLDLVHYRRPLLRAARWHRRALCRRRPDWPRPVDGGVRTCEGPRLVQPCTYPQKELRNVFSVVDLVSPRQRHDAPPQMLPLDVFKALSCTVNGEG